MKHRVPVLTGETEFRRGAVCSPEVLKSLGLGYNIICHH